MNELIPVTPREIGGVMVLTADGRELHAYLGPDTRFNDWIDRRIVEYGFEEGKDFCSFLSKTPMGGRPPKEYTLALNMAKELAMVERTPKGKEARQYFIDCEARALAGNAPALPAPAERKPARVRGRTPLEQVKIINFVGDALKDVPGVRLGMVAAAKLKAFEEHTGIDFSDFRRALPPLPLDRMVHLNPTQIGARIAEQTGRTKVSSQLVNKTLLDLGLQRKVEDGYVLTEAGTKYGEIHDYRAKNEHAGLQIDWYESVVNVVRDNLPAEKAKRGHGNGVIQLQPPKNQGPEPQGALL